MADQLPIVLLILSWGVGSSYGECSNPSGIGPLLDAALAEYDRESSPAPKVTVQLALDIRHAAINDQAATLRLLADLHMSWQDSRLSFNESEWGCSWALVAAERLWLPDVTLVTAAATAAGVEPLRARLTTNGAVSWATRLDLSVPVTMHLEYWPEDVQTAVVKFASRAHSIDEIDVTIQDAQRVVVFESGAWEILSLSGTANTQLMAEGASRRLAAWTIALRRRAPAQAMVARVVITTVLLLLLAAALLPPQSRAPLSAAAAFTMAIWLCGAAWRAGGGSGSAVRSVSAGGCVCAASALCALFAALVTRAAASTHAPPQFVRSAVATANKYLPFTTQIQSAGENGTWVAAAQILDAVLLAALWLTLLIVLCVYL